MLKFLEGKKTYTLALVAIMTALTAYIAGTADLMAAIQMALVGGVAATLRSALTSLLGSAPIADVVVTAVEDAVTKATTKK